MGASGGGPHALACAALLPERVTGAVALACPAPYTEAFDWFAGMVDPGGLKAGLQGREARAALPQDFDQDSFTAADWAVLQAEWAPLGADAMAAGQAGPDGLIDDDVAYTKPWGFALEAVQTPVLVVQGGEDRVIPPSHADALLRALPERRAVAAPARRARLDPARLPRRDGLAQGELKRSAPSSSPPWRSVTTSCA